PTHTLRRWERRFKQLKPRRNRAGRRYYVLRDIEVVRRVKDLLWRQKLTPDGAQQRLNEEERGEGVIRTGAQAHSLIDKIEIEVRAMLDMLEAEPISDSK
ncbi:MAG: MerR family transcriptional regulator, partial [Nitrospiraceae bacterium]|nr:MerR family transcriptional regulator [Nitrospiraceae bacterium]